MSTETISAISFIIFELISTSVLLICAYSKSEKLGLVLTGVIQGMLGSMTILSSLGIDRWWAFAMGSILIFASGIIGGLLALLIYVSIVKSKNLTVDAKAL